MTVAAPVTYRPANKEDRKEDEGFGKCHRCKTPWNRCKEHSTLFTESDGCFPLCEDCWQSLPTEERLPFYLDMWTDWLSMSLESELDLSQWELIEQAVLAGK